MIKNVFVLTLCNLNKHDMFSFTVFRRSSLSSVSRGHFMGQSVSVCEWVASPVRGRQPAWSRQNCSFRRYWYFYRHYSCSYSITVIPIAILSIVIPSVVNFILIVSFLIVTVISTAVIVTACSPIFAPSHLGLAFAGMDNPGTLPS